MTDFTIFRLYRMTAAEWVASNYVLESGREGYETDTRKRKVGNGVTAWNDLPYDTAASVDAVRGQISVITSVVNPIAVQSTYQVSTMTGTLDSVNSSGLIRGTTSLFALKNNTDRIKIFDVSATVNCTAGNNHILGVRLAKNGTSIAESEFKGVAASSTVEAELHTRWMVSLNAGQEVSLHFANFTQIHDITVKRAAMVAIAVG
jgi:hypothetical protein